MKLYHEQRGYHNKKAEPRTPNLLSLNQDIVAWSQEEKCGLKYVIQTLSKPVRSSGIND